MPRVQPTPQSIDYEVAPQSNLLQYVDHAGYKTGLGAEVEVRGGLIHPASTWMQMKLGFVVGTAAFYSNQSLAIGSPSHMSEAEDTADSWLHKPVMCTSTFLGWCFG